MGRRELGNKFIDTSSISQVQVVLHMFVSLIFIIIYSKWSSQIFYTGFIVKPLLN